MLALLFYLGFSSPVSLYVISALFGLFQDGIVPSHAIIIREYLPAHEAGMRFGMVIMATLFGMAFGGWMSGVIFDATGSYSAAFANGALWNLLNLCIAVALLTRSARRRAPA
jgi:MFS family permease